MGGLGWSEVGWGRGAVKQVPGTSVPGQKSQTKQYCWLYGFVSTVHIRTQRRLRFPLYTTHHIRPAYLIEQTLVREQTLPRLRQSDIHQPASCSCRRTARHRQIRTLRKLNQRSGHCQEDRILLAGDGHGQSDLLLIDDHYYSPPGLLFRRPLKSGRQ